MKESFGIDMETKRPMYGEVLPPLPKPARVQESPQVEERLKVIRTELTHYIEQPTPPPKIVVVERQVAEPETVWDEIGMAVGDGVAAVRGFISEITTIWRGR